MQCPPFTTAIPLFVVASLKPPILPICVTAIESFGVLRAPIVRRVGPSTRCRFTAVLPAISPPAKSYEIVKLGTLPITVSPENVTVQTKPSPMIPCDLTTVI